VKTIDEMGPHAHEELFYEGIIDTPTDEFDLLTVCQNILYVWVDRLHELQAIFRESLGSETLRAEDLIESVGDS